MFTHSYNYHERATVN